MLEGSTTNPRVTEGCRFHHLGCATRCIEAESTMLKAMGYRVEGETFIDETQGIRGYFATGPGPRLEILENLSGRDTLTPWIEQGIRYYHLAFLTPDLERSLFVASSFRGRLVVKPTPATAFGGRDIAFYLFRDGTLLEFIQDYG